MKTGTQITPEVLELAKVINAAFENLAPFRKVSRLTSYEATQIAKEVVAAGYVLPTAQMTTVKDLVSLPDNVKILPAGGHREGVEL